MTWYLRLLCCLALVFSVPSAFAGPPSSPPAPAHPPAQAVGIREGQAAPAFRLTNVGGHATELAGFRGRPVALFFFCGCSWCHDCAQAWGRLQHQGVLGASGDGRAAPATVVVFSGDAASARAFLAETGLDPKATAVLPDPQMRVTLRYDAEPCPRAFVVDRRGVILYSNTHPGDAPREGTASVITARALDAVRACAAASHG